MAQMKGKLMIDRRACLAMLLAAGVPTTASANTPKKSGSKLSKTRATPLFSDEADARAVFKRYCIDEADDPISLADVELLIARLRPYIWIEARKTSEVSKYKTHFGGAPELPPGASWPLRPPAVHAKAQIDRLLRYRKEAAWLSSYITQEVPFEFIAQIDLAEAAQQTKASEGLPAAGRLLFFWDDSVGIYAGGQKACKVIFDETPADQVVALPIPPKFSELEKVWAAAEVAGAKETYEGLKKSLPDTIEMMKKSGVDQASLDSAVKALDAHMANPPPIDPNMKKPFVYPHRTMKLTSLLQLPHTHTPEAILDAALDTLTKTSAGEQCYEILLSNDTGPFDTKDKFANEARRQRFMGTPVPEQDDPRFEAIIDAGYPPAPWEGDALRDAANKASEWRLLLQIAVADLAQVLREGTIYFLVRNDDLARRDFSKAHAYYQQT
jgi:uncharacterized protein YwqG